MHHCAFLIKQAWSNLKRKPGFILTVIGTMGLTLGALLCVLTIAYCLIIKPLPYPEQEKLYRVEINPADAQGTIKPSGFSYPVFRQLYLHQSVFSESALIDFRENVLSSHPQQPILQVGYTTPEWFSLLGATMIIGRSFKQDEGLETHRPAAIISYETWQQQFSGDQDILNQTLTFSGVNHRIVGVLAQSFIEPEIFKIGRKTNVWLPWDFNLYPDAMRRAWNGLTHSIVWVGKLKNEYSVTQAEQRLSTNITDVWQAGVTGMDFFQGWTLKIKLRAFKNVIIGESANSVMLLIASVIGLVLIACTNISNLFLSRTAELLRPLAIRAALGATKQDLFKTLFSESGLLMLISVVAALIIAHAGFYILQQHLSDSLPRLSELSNNTFTFILAAACLYLFAFLFAKLCSQIVNYRRLNTLIQTGSKGSGTQIPKRLRLSLIMIQISIATALIFININLFKQSISEILQPLGYELTDRYDLRLLDSTIPPRTGESVNILYNLISKRLEQLPQIASISQSNSLLNERLSRGTITGTTTLINANNDQRHAYSQSHTVDDHYFQTIGQTLLQGRFFSATDIRDQNKAIIVNDAFAKQFKPDENILGQKMHYPDGYGPFTIVGLVKAINIPGDKHKIPERVYFVNTFPRKMQFMLALNKQQTLNRAQINSAISEIDPNISVLSFNSFADTRYRLLFSNITTAITSAALTLLTIILAAAGLYGVLSYSTQLQRFELGIRMAIGAKRHDLIWLIIKNNSTAILLGIMISLMVMYLLYTRLSVNLPNFTNNNVLVPLTITLLLIGSISIAACYLPLRKIINCPTIHSLKGGK